MKLLYLFFFALVAAVMAQPNSTDYPRGIRLGHRRRMSPIQEALYALNREFGIGPKPLHHEPEEDKAVNERIKTFMNRRRRLQPTPAPDEVPWDWTLNDRLNRPRRLQPTPVPEDSDWRNGVKLERFKHGIKEDEMPDPNDPSYPRLAEWPPLPRISSWQSSHPAYIRARA